MESILTSIKKMLGIEEEYTHFDPDIIMHINTAFMRLRQMGVGPAEGFRIEDDTSTWYEFDPEADYEAVKTYIYIEVKLVFDPPLSSAVIDVLKENRDELKWRLNVEAETPTTLNGEEEIQNGE